MALAEADDAITVAAGKVYVVEANDKGCPGFLAEGAEEVHDFSTAFGIEAGNGFVSEDEFGGLEEDSG